MGTEASRAQKTQSDNPKTSTSQRRHIVTNFSASQLQKRKPVTKSNTFSQPNVQSSILEFSMNFLETSDI
ncbi:hypothetical protein SS50377_26095 [Spironucleus salmonicida]|uniref:Uncharacterized protein n=1 Tax=Spironucleus salmonicida TaxID=348837 RepID=V6LGD7_9EUKA|nr:hypothetical protein SS50377_26095 [Spironucleus salmonicida]|eukprot:EST42736.1 Hypothetical protein SS50377_17657 [Spironucleus salmonicida]